MRDTREGTATIKASREKTASKAPKVRVTSSRRGRRERLGVVRIGISGFRYPPWRGVFYPVGLPQNRELEYASRVLRSVELNGSFYSLQRPSSYLGWYAATPLDFVFAVKGARYITHNKKLRDCEGPLANFFASGVLALEEKLGPILWQLPPQLSFDAERLEAFFERLPKTTDAASELGRRADARVGHGSYLDIRTSAPLRYAIEVRHESFDDPAFLRLLRKADVALCIADTAGKWPSLEGVTTDFVYVRLHGSRKLYASGYTAAELDTWASRIEGWVDGARADDDVHDHAMERRTTTEKRKGRDVFVYFDNDVGVRAPFDAMNLAARLGFGERVAFPRGRLRAAEAVRGVEEVRSSWNRWRTTSRETTA